jgi:rRNA maturation endonuclease Nob1
MKKKPLAEAKTTASIRAVLTVMWRCPICNKRNEDTEVCKECGHEHPATQPKRST